MKKLNFIITNAIIWLATSFFGCQNNPIEKVQGVFSADKAELKRILKEKVDNESLLAAALLDKAIENAIIEFKISGDSINGLMFLVGQTTIISSKINVENDSMVVNSGNMNAYLIPNEKGLIFMNKHSKMGIQLLKSDKLELSDDTKNAINSLAQKEKSLKEFNDNLGKWEILLMISVIKQEKVFHLYLFMANMKTHLSLSLMSM